MKLFLTLISILVGFHCLHSQISIGTPGQVQWCYWSDLPDDEFGELYADEYYPYNPDGCHTLFSLQSPTNYNNDFGSLMRGFIRIDTTCQVRFAVTGDDDTQFHLSSDDNPNNLNIMAYVDGHTGSTELDKDTLTQWSDYITLTKDSYYYFELRHVDGSGGDHSAVWWQTPFTGSTIWNYVSTGYLYDVDLNEPQCPIRHTNCDDGDANTINDQEDGFCNCVGEPVDKDACIGERFDITRYIYTDIAGSNLNDLLLNPNYPTLPTTSASFEYLGIGNISSEDNTGSLIEGFISVPVSGIYHFNITGNARARMFLSIDQDPANKSAHQMLTLSSTGATEHDDDPSQSMLANLTAGAFYYFEITHKEGTGSEHLGIFWKTPFAHDNNWHRVPLFYLYDYDCELACIPDGTICDDGDPFTNNDQYSNCDCVGTPCSGPDCDSPLANYSNYPECDITDQLDNRADASWTSCQVSPNPAGRGSRHWIQYDFGELYKLYQTQIWNYNVANQVDKGFSSVIIDYSYDGINWEQFGTTYTWPLADGSGSYSGFQGPNFNGLGARYVLITSMNANHASGCRGIGKVMFNASGCPPEASACSDGDDFTMNDLITNCNCTGTSMITNDCNQNELNLGNQTLASNNYSAIEKVISNNLIADDSLVSFVAGNNIELNNNFEIMAGAQFIAQILDCSSMAAKQEIEHILKSKKGIYLNVMDIEDSENHSIEFIVPYKSHVTLELYNKKGKWVRTLLDIRLDNPGFYNKVLRGKRFDLDRGYKIVLTTDQDKTEKVI